MKDKTPLSLKLEGGVNERLDECAKQTRMKKYQLALMAIEAAVDAIERNGYKLVVPIQFDVAHVPVAAKPSGQYPPHRQQVSLTEEKPSSDAFDPSLEAGKNPGVQKHFSKFQVSAGAPGQTEVKPTAYRQPKPKGGKKLPGGSRPKPDHPAG